MRVIPPAEITEAMVLINSAAEPSVGEIAYANNVYFNDGDRAVIGAPSATVTISNASPAVISWAAHGLADGTSVILTTTGALPAGLVAGQRYFVVRSAKNSFMLSETEDGLPIATSSAGSGTHTATAQVHELYESLRGSSSVVTLAVASPGVVPWIGHGLLAGAPITFTTTGTLPTGLTAGTTYYVLNPADDSFNVSATAGGAAINFTGTPSGVHTAHGNPNIGHPPARDDGTYWAKVGASNKWGLLDNENSVGTEAPSPYVFSFKPGQRTDALAATGVLADSILLEIVVDGETIRSETISLSTREVANAYDYCFKPFTYRSVAQWFDLPPITNAEITLTFTRSSGNVRVGNLWPGQAIYLGQTQHNSEAGALNYSEWTRDQWGKSKFKRVGTVPTVDVVLNVPKYLATSFNRAIATLDARPAFWSGIDDQSSGYFEPLALAGSYRAMTVNMDRPNDANGKIKLEGI